MSRILRYQISDWNQITECLSNNSRNLFISLSKYIDKSLKGLCLHVNHVNYGVLFAAMINGSGSLLSNETEDGYDIPFMTTEQILTELQRFGFYVKYDVKSNLPQDVISFLATIDNLGYDKITRVAVETKQPGGSVIWKPTILVFKAVPENDDILTFDCRLTRTKFNKKLADNVIMNVTHEPDLEWDWLNYICNISDILDENIDPVDGFETQTDASNNVEDITPPESYTFYGEVTE